jgi:N-acetylneuraminic acid mutarotase
MKSILLISFIVAAYAASWDVVSFTGPKTSVRSSGVAVALQHKTWCDFGGHLQCESSDFCASAFYNDVHCFDTKTNVWTAPTITGTGPDVRTFHSMVADTDHSFVTFGGLKYPPTVFPVTVYGDMWRFNTHTNTWANIPQGLLTPGARAGATAFMFEGKMWIMGGLSPALDTFNDLWSFDFNSNTWTEESANNVNDTGVPHKRYRAGVAVNDKDDGVVIFSGDLFLTDSHAPVDDTWLFDLVGNLWTELNNNLTNRQDAVVVSYKRKVFVMFGDTEGSAGRCVNSLTGVGNNPQSTMWKLDLNHDSTHWTQVFATGGPRALMRAAYVVFDNDLYVYNGFDFFCNVPGNGVMIQNTNVYHIDLNTL